MDDYECPVTGVVNLCADSSNGYYADPRNSQKYYYCYHKAKVIELSCEEGKVYDGNQKKCLRREEVEEQRELWQGSSCSGGKKGFYPDLASACTKYYYCIGEEKTELECQFGFLFNGDICVQASVSTFRCPVPNSIMTSTTRS
jgi:hypothetical protein